MNSNRRTRLGILGAALTVAAAAISLPHVATAAGEDKPAAAKKADEAPKKPDAKAEKDKPSADKPDAGPGDAGAGDGGKTAGPLPAGHPDVGELPPGHPSVDEGAEADPHAGESPHGANPHGDAPRRGGNSGFFEAPPDTAVEDQTLPPGTMVFTIRDADDRPIPNATAILGILKSSVAQGDKRERREITTDAEGTARLDGLPVGAGTSYRVTTMRGLGTYATDAFALSDKAGKRVVLHAYEATDNVEGALVGAQAFVFVSLREGVLSVEQLFNVFNIGKVAWVPGKGAAQVGLPEGYQAFRIPDGMTDVRFIDEPTKGPWLSGTIAPGRHEASFSYQVPLDGKDRQTFRVELPPRVGEVRIFSEANKTMGLQVAGFPEAQRQAGRDGRKVMVTMRQAMQGERGINALDITITGLPVPGNTRWFALFFALSAAGLAAAYTIRQRAEGAVPDEAKDDLLEAREALLGEFVALEKAHQKGDIGPKTYGRLKAALLDALARIEARLDEVKAARAEQRRRDREGTRRPRGEARGEGGSA
ncbi:carboxypeptidase-like regulatory domain-containing protein [Polyangium mundeleinium]|uniref:Carboxypeptidase-like regulatory domain-containing protein n=1 Tax=Polyangium mundeleinium TaxID=2995306 RepID=A0ABT5F6M8_9BACT|nr:carboxypeptidase-like regulatory domain-containing protein [Polyangium mundeleinium]MDC0749745.1 carboxypeptidase-like regulatory domain-containing protein [Polyangium mundeleinium]